MTALPAMMIAAAGASVLLALGSAWALTRWGPRRIVPAGFVASALLLLGEWWLLGRAGRPTAVLVYLHYAAFGAVLVSGFWSIVGERFDPRAARRHIGRIGGAGTLGGVIGGLVAAQAGASMTVSVMLPVLAACHLTAAGCSLATGWGITPTPRAPDEEVSTAQVATRLPYLRILVALVLLTTLAEVLLDYVFKVRVTETAASGESLLQFFALFYTATGLLAFGVQTLASRRTLRALGLARTVGTLPVATVLGGGAALLAGGLAPVVAARGAEAVVRSSLYRSGYEMLFAPLLAAERRASKAVLDVGITRVGDVTGALVVRLSLLSPAAITVLLVLTVAVSAIAAALAVRLQRSYAAALERALTKRAGPLDALTIEDSAFHSALIHTVGGAGDLAGTPPPAVPPPPVRPVARRDALQARDAGVVRAALAAGPLGPELVPVTIPLLAWDAVARTATDALRQAALFAPEALVTALLNPDQEFTVRRRLPIVMAAAPVQAVADGLLAGLHDTRFEVRYRCGLALHKLTQENPALRIDRDQVVAAVLREVSVDRRVWESHRLLDRGADEEWSPMFDAVLRERADRGLQHVFTVLALILPRRPLQLAFRGLFANDPHVRGTALEYLESTLPEPVRQALWHFLEDTRKQPARRSRDEIVRDLLASEATIALDLQRFRRPSQDG